MVHLLPEHDTSHDVGTPTRYLLPSRAHDVAPLQPNQAPAHEMAHARPPSTTHQKPEDQAFSSLGCIIVVLVVPDLHLYGDGQVGTDIR